MQQLLVRNVDERTIRQLRRHARRARRSLQSEVKEALQRAAPMTRDEFIAWAKHMRRSLPPQPGDSADLIREDRDR